MNSKKVLPPTSILRETTELSNSSPCTVKTAQGLSITYRDRFLLSSRYPVQNCQKILKTLPKEDFTLYLIPSPLFAYGLEEWSETWGKNNHGLIIELESVLKTFIPANLSSHFTILETLDNNALEEFFKRNPKENFKKVRMVSISGGLDLHLLEYENLRDLLELEVKLFWQNKSTLMVMGPLYLKNIFENLKALPSPKTIPVLSGTPLLLGAGESTEYLIPQIKAQRKNLYLVAVDTVLPVMRDAGITPDAVVVLEAQIYNLEDFVGIPWDEIHLWADLTAHPGTFRLPWKSQNVFLSDFAPLGLLQRIKALGIPCIPPRGSVGVAALELCLSLFSGPVGIIGLDFAFTPGKTHAKGAPALSCLLRKSNRLVSLETSPISQALPLPSSVNHQVTTPALKQYGHLAREICAASHRVKDLRPGGLDMGVNKSTWEDFLREGNEYYGSQKTFSVLKKDSPIPQEKITSFLGNERTILETLWQDFDALNQGKTPPDFMDHLVQADYLYVNFPDSGLPHWEPGFLSRVKASLAFYWRRLKTEEPKR